MAAQFRDNSGQSVWGEEEEGKEDDEEEGYRDDEDEEDDEEEGNGDDEDEDDPDEPNDAADPAFDWALENFDKMRRAYTLKGGWEGWAQVELALALEDYRKFPFRKQHDAQRAAQTVVEREVPVYLTGRGRASQNRADIVVRQETQDGNAEFFILELKCEGQYNKGQFVDAVKKDVKKLEGDIKDEYLPAHLWAYAISTSQETYDRLLDLYPEVETLSLKPDEDVTVGDDEPKIFLWVLGRELEKNNQLSSSSSRG